MTITPVEIRHVTLGRRPLGYDRKGVDELLETIAGSYEEVWRERADLSDRVEQLEAELTRTRELEDLLRNTLMSAERASDEMRLQARRESKLMLEEARTSARQIVASAENERERIRAETRRLRALETEMRADYRAFLVSALDRLKANGHATEVSAPGTTATGSTSVGTRHEPEE
jgi:cell division initiation protein